jgi:N-acyl-D-glutamate deacylase
MRAFLGTAGLAASLAVVAPHAIAQQDQTFDIVLVGGRVMDPESGMDAVRNVGIIAGRIAAISAQPLAGRTMVPAAGLVVAPGFIDLHAHGQGLRQQPVPGP